MKEDIIDVFIRINDPELILGRPQGELFILSYILYVTEIP